MGEVKIKLNSGELSFGQKAICGSFAGFVGSLVGNPADLILIRIQADSRLPVEQRRNYNGFFNAFGRIIKEEGVLALWRGATPTVIRAMVLNLAMLASYDEIKERLNKTLGRNKDELDVRLAYFCFINSEQAHSLVFFQPGPVCLLIMPKPNSRK